MRHLVAVALMTAWVSSAYCQIQSAALYPVEQGFRFGYINRGGRVVVPFQYEHARALVEGRAAVSVPAGNDTARWGYLDITGKVAIPLKFDKAEDFSEGLAAVCSTQGCGFIDANGKVVIALRFESAGSFHDGLAPVSRDHRFGYLDHSGRLVIASRFDKALEFSEGLAAVVPADSGKFGFIDTTGATVIPPQFDDVDRYSEGIAAVQSGGKWLAIDKSGKTIMATAATQPFRFSEGFAALCRVHPQDKASRICVYVTSAWQVAFQAEFWEAGPFTEGLAGVAIAPSAENYYMDKGGKAVIKFDEAFDLYPFKNGFATQCRISLDILNILTARQCQVIDLTGKVIWKSAPVATPVPPNGN